MQTGITLLVRATESAGCIVTKKSLALRILRRFEDTPTPFGVIRSPITSECELETSVRLQAGEIFMLGGALNNTENRTGSQLLGGSTANADHQEQALDLIVLVRPRITRFVRLLRTGHGRAERNRRA